MAQIASQFGIHPIQVGKWKKELLNGSEAVFESKQSRKKNTDWDRVALERKVGQLTIELDYLKKKLGY